MFAGLSQSVTTPKNSTALLQHWGGIPAVAICPSTNDIYTGSRDCRIKRWSSRVKSDRATSSRSNGLSHAAPPSASTNGSISPLRCIGDLSNHTGWVSALLATPDVLVSASCDATVKIWSARDGRQLANLADIHDDYVTRLAAAPLTGRFASAGLRGHLHFWDLEAVQAVAVAAAGGAAVTDDLQSRARHTPEGGCVNSGSIYALHCTPDGRLYAFNGPEGCESCPFLDVCARMCGLAPVHLCGVCSPASHVRLKCWLFMIMDLYFSALLS